MLEIPNKLYLYIYFYRETLIYFTSNRWIIAHATEVYQFLRVLRLKKKSIANAFSFSDTSLRTRGAKNTNEEEDVSDRASMSEAARFVYSGSKREREKKKRRRMENVNKKGKKKMIKKHLFRRLNSLPK